MFLRRSLRRFPIALALAVALGASCGPAGKADGPVGAAPRTAATLAGPIPADSGPPLPLDPAVVAGKLDNGLTYYIRKNGKPEKRAELWLAVDAGSVLEDDDQRGLAHFVEHMAFNGTKKYAKQEIVTWLESTGMKFGADVNASTSFDETIYQIQVPTDDPALLARGLDVLHEWAGSISFDPTEVAKERGVVLEERRLGRGAEGRLLDKIVPAALPGSTYGVRIPIGTEERLKTVTPDVLRRFYRDWYRPDLMAVVVVGDVEPAAIEQQIRATFGDLVAPARPRPRPARAVPPHDRTVTVTVQDPELPVTVVAVASKQPRRVLRGEADLRVVLAERLFTAMLNQRLVEIGQRPEAPWLGAGVGNQAIIRPIEVWFQGAVVKGDRAAETLETLAAELGRVAASGFTDSEIARARQDLLHGYEVAAKEQGKVESRQYVDEIIRLFLTGEAMPGIEVEVALARRIVPAITAAELQAIAARAASEQNRLVIAASNSKVALPAEAALLAAVARGRAKVGAAYVDDAVKGPLVAAPPTAGTIKSERKIEALGVTEWTLSNGVKVVLKPTDYQNDQILFGGFSLGGTSLAKDADWIAAASAAEVAAAGGAGALSATQLTKSLSGTGIDLDVELRALSQVVTGRGQPSHLDALLQLAYLRLTAPRGDERAVAAWRDQAVTARKMQLDDPRVVFGARFEEAATRKHPRHRLLTADDFVGLDTARALDFYRQRFSSFRGFTFLLIGNFELAAIKPAVLTYLGGLPASGKAERWRDVRVVRPRGEVVVEVAQGIEPKAHVRLLFHRKERYSREAAHDLEALAAALSIRLREELREGMGGTYGVGVYGALVREPKPEATITIEFGCAPESVEPLIAATRKLVGEFKRVGPPAEVVAKIQETERREHETQLRNNGYWFDALYDSYRHRDDPRVILRRPELIAQLTPARLRAAAIRYLGADQIVGVLRPAASPAAQAAPAKK